MTPNKELLRTSIPWHIWNYGLFSKINDAVVCEIPWLTMRVRMGSLWLTSLVKFIRLCQFDENYLDISFRICWPCHKVNACCHSILPEINHEYDQLGILALYTGIILAWSLIGHTYDKLLVEWSKMITLISPSITPVKTSFNMLTSLSPSKEN